MNSAVIFPPPAPELKLARPSAEKWAATVAEERRRLQEDQEALREREVNLKEYEARLRAWQAELDAGRATVPATPAAPTVAPFLRPSSRVPFADDSALQAAWEKLHRARELLEAELTHLRDDRFAMREIQENQKRREAALAEREAAVSARERTAATMPTPVPVAPVEDEPSAVARLTRAPFEMARSVFARR